MHSHFRKTLFKSSVSSPFENPDISTYMSLWYGCLRVVIEGWQSLNLSDLNVDMLLDPAKIKILNDFRNDTFHYQKNYFPKRTVALFNDPMFPAWAQAVHTEIGKSLLKMIKESK